MTFISKTPGILPIQNTSAVLISTNPIFLYGQPIFETDTNRGKVGDGLSTYLELTYSEWGYEIVQATSAVANTYTGTFSKPLFLGYFPMQRIRVLFASANTGAATINLNGLGAIAIKKNVSTALASGDILAGGIYHLTYDGTNFQIEPGVGGSAGVTPTLAQVLTAGRDADVSGIINDNTSIPSIDINNRILGDFTGAVASVDYGGRNLVDSTGLISIDWESRFLYDEGGVAVLDWRTINLQLVNSSGFAVLKWATSQLLNSAWSYDANYAPFSGRQIPDAAWVLSTTGAYLPLAGGTMVGNILFTDNTYDIGASGATRPRRIYVGTEVVSPLFTGALAGNATTATTSTNLSGGLGGSIPYQSAASTTAMLANGAAGQVLTSAGTTLAPVWSTPTTGTVTSVSVVTNQGVSGSVATATTTPAITISLGALTGVTSFNGLVVTANTGAITTGSWAATVIPLAFGGTNANLTAALGGIFYSTATAGAILAPTATAGQHLQSGASAAPSWTTATFPSTATGTGTILRANGTNWVATTNTYPNTTDVNQILFATTANVIGGSATLLTDGTYLYCGQTTAGGTESFAFQKNQNASTSMVLSNTTNGTAGLVYFNVTNAATGSGGAGVGTGAASASYTSSTIFEADRGFIFCSKVNGFNIGTNANTGVDFWSNSTRRISLLAAGQLLIGYTALSGTEYFGIQKNQDAGTLQYITNQNSGTSSYAGIIISNVNNVATGLFIATMGASWTTSGIFAQSTNLILSSSTGGLNIGSSGSAPTTLWSNSAERVRLTSVGNIKIAGTAVRATTEGTNHLDIFDGTAPVGTLANGVSIYSASGKLMSLDAAGNSTQLGGDIKINTVGNGYYAKEGTNATMGLATLVGGTLVVNTTKVTANSRIFLTGEGGNIVNLGFYSVSARTAGTSFTILSSNILDTNTVGWIIIEPS